MIKDITTLKINGQCYKGGKDLELFSERINIVYGRNGSGKSTIAKAIGLIANGKYDDELSAEFNRPLTEKEKNSIYIYDESFIDNKIKFKEDGLGTIVMLGEQNDVQGEIDALEESLNEHHNHLQSVRDELIELKNEKNPASPIYAKNQLSKSLKKSGNSWSERERKIKKYNQKGPVNEDLLNKLTEQVKNNSELDKNGNILCLKENILFEYQKISETLNEKIREILLIESSGGIQTKLLTQPDSVNFDEVKSFLKTCVNEPTLNERERHILHLVKNDLIPNFINESTKHFNSSEHNDICPYCLRDISYREIQDLNTIIENILSEEVRNFKQNLTCFLDRITEYSNRIQNNDNLSILENIVSLKEVVEKYKKRKSKFLNFLRIIYDKLHEKLKQPYKEIDTKFIEQAIEHHKLYTQSAMSVNNAIDTHNSELFKIEQTRKKLAQDNFKLALYENYELIVEYINKKENETKLNKLAKEISDKKSEISKKISNLKEKQKNTNIALEYINKSLNFIFFSSNRLQLENIDGIYRVKSRNDKVEPSKLSIGERNAISLAYFFISMFTECSIDSIYNEERLVIIDDPVTSFDFENRVGILSFLFWQTEEILKGNSNSKILFLSHDIQTIYDLEKFTNNIETERDSQIKETIKHSIQSLNNFSLKKIGSDKSKQAFNEYKSILHEVFEFAKRNTAPTEEESFGIGNKIRKIAEAISSFLYGCGIDSLFRKKEILEGISSHKQRHYRNTLSRLILNGASHSKEKIRSFNYNAFTFAPEEVQKIARSFLLFLKDTHPLHLTCLLDNSNSISEITKWEDDIFPKC